MTKEVSAVQVDPKGPSRNRCARFLDPLPSLTRRPGRPGARLARREEGAYRVYATDEQRSQAGCIGVQDWHRYSVTGPKDAPGGGDLDLGHLAPRAPHGVSRLVPPHVAETLTAPGICTQLTCMIRPLTLNRSRSQEGENQWPW